MPLPTARPKKPMKLPPRINWDDPALQPQRKVVPQTTHGADDLIQRLALLRSPDLIPDESMSAADAMKVLRALQYTPHLYDPTADILDRETASYGQHSLFADKMRVSLRGLVVTMERIIAQRLEEQPALSQELRLVRTADFGEGGIQKYLPGDKLTLGNSLVDVWFYVGLIDHLPAGHWLREALPADDYLDLKLSALPFLDHRGLVAGRPAIVLGWPCAMRTWEVGPPRQWYDFEGAVRGWTGAAVQTLRKKKAEDEAREKQEKYQEELRFWASAEGQLIQRQRLAAEAEARRRSKGLPAEPPDIPPAIREGDRTTPTPKPPKQPATEEED